jgi:hypothetical protein
VSRGSKGGETEQKWGKNGQSRHFMVSVWRGSPRLEAARRLPEGVKSLPGVHYAGYTRSKGGVLPQLVHIKCLEESRVGNIGGKGQVRPTPVVLGAFSALRSS